jgi:hypothetical protein
MSISRTPGELLLGEQLPQGLMMVGRSSRAVFQSVSLVTPKYSWTTMFRSPRISTHGISGVTREDSLTEAGHGLSNDAETAGDGFDGEFVGAERGNIAVRFNVSRDASCCFENVFYSEAPLPRWHGRPLRTRGRATGASRHHA